MSKNNEIPFMYDRFQKKDIYITKEMTGWKESDRNAAIWTFGKDDPLYFYMKSGIDVGFYYEGHKYWIESPFEDFRGHGGDIWSLSICDHPAPEADENYIVCKYLGQRRHDADERTELCFYDGVEAFLENAKIDGKDIRTVLNESFITDL